MDSVIIVLPPKPNLKCDSQKIFLPQPKCILHFKKNKTLENSYNKQKTINTIKNKLY